MKKIIMTSFLFILVLIGFLVLKPTETLKQREDSSLLSFYIEEEGVKKQVSSIPTTNNYFVSVDCNKSATGTWNYQTKSIRFSNLTETKTKCSVTFKESFLATNFVTNLSVTDTKNLIVDTKNDIRFVGSNPNNYVMYDNELWRIVGLFHVSNGTTTEKRVKLVRDTPLPNSLSFDNNQTNNYANSTMKYFLNNSFYSEISSYEQTMVDDVVWNIGGISVAGAVNSQNLYDFERGTLAYNNHPTTWKGKVGTVYASDYTFAMTGNDVSNRATCLSHHVFTLSNYPECYLTSYLKASSYMWVMNGVLERNQVLLLDTNGIINQTDPLVNSVSIYTSPAIYLKTNVAIGNGSGTSEHPYQLLLP